LGSASCRIFQKDSLESEYEAKKRAADERAAATPKEAVVLRDLMVQAEVGSLPLKVGISVRRASGYLPYESLRFDVRREGKTVGEVVGTNRGPGVFGAALAFEAEGPHSVFARVGGEALAATNCHVWKVPSVGEPQFALTTDTGDVMEVRPGDEVRGEKAARVLVVRRWASVEDEPAYAAEWRRGDRMVQVKKGRLGSPQAFLGGNAFALNTRSVDRFAAPIWLRQQVSFPVPDDQAVEDWEVVFHQTGHPSLRATIPGRSQGLGRLAVTVVRQETSLLEDAPVIMVRSDYPVTAAELRALTRSPELLRLRFEMSGLMREDLGISEPVKPIRGESPMTRFSRQQAADAKVKAGAARTNEELKRERAALWKRMKPLVEASGGPWKAEEVPFTLAS
jgi:hypothetical protein